MSETELAWAAGFFDGEGSIGCYDSSKGPQWKRLSFSVVQTDIRPLERFQEAIGGYGKIKIKGPNKEKHPTWKTVYTFVTANSETIKIIIDLLWPYLCQPKKDQVTRAMDMWADNKKTVRRYTPHAAK